VTSVRSRRAKNGIKPALELAVLEMRVEKALQFGDVVVVNAGDNETHASTV
jgi:hypothetical protein